MHTARVATNLRCNQNCGYCTSRRSEDARAFVHPSAVRTRIDAALAGGARELVLTGGEPAMRRDLASLVAYARERGATVTLETNATLLDEARAAELRAAGLGLARVNLAGWGPALDAITRDAGGFEATLAGLRALAGAGVPLEIAVAIVRDTRALAPALPPHLIETVGSNAVRGIVVTVPTQSPDPSALVTYPEAVETIVALEAAARSVGIPVKLAPGSGPPPCVFPPRNRPTYLFAMTTGARRRPGYQHPPACGGCRVADRCAGLPDEYVARHGVPTMHPITEDRVRRRLSLISTVEEQVRREFVTPNRYQDPTHGDLDEDIIRVNFHCNQACRFCFVSTHLPPPGEDRVREAIIAAAARGVKITLSGGEPTLNPRLVEYVRLARAHSALPVQLQTNAIRLDDLALARALADAGLDEAFVSLHGSTAEVADAVTGAPGTFARQVAGIDNLARVGVRLILNFVICETNLRDLVPWVRFAGGRWPGAFLNISFVAPSTDVVPRDREFIPRYSDALPEIARALAEAARLGVELGGFESMCGIPLCLVPASLDRYTTLTEIPPGFDRGEFVRAEACHRCALEGRCYGVRRGYAEMHGTSELTPVAPSAAAKG
jgi:MoaA/NifB/PqqE/SkfB family radical SAM enzyme